MKFGVFVFHCEIQINFLYYIHRFIEKMEQKYRISYSFMNICYDVSGFMSYLVYLMPNNPFKIFDAACVCDFSNFLCLVTRVFICCCASAFSVS